MIPFHHKVVIVRCENCDYPLYSEDEDEIEKWKDLEDQTALECPICGGRMRFKAERGEINVEAMIE